MHKQPIGKALDWHGAKRPERLVLQGQYCRLEPLEAGHTEGLFKAFQADTKGRNWTYMVNGPYPDLPPFKAWVSKASTGKDPLFFAICLPDGTPLGYASYMRIAPEMGVMEVGSINLSPALQGTRAATEAQYLLMQHAFQLGYRRFEWKCDALNAASIKAAQRLGFTYEGTFRQALVYKGRNRDTAWFSVLNSEWPALKARFERWLAPENFDSGGQQLTAL